jgi:hypothetical protein
MYILNYFYSSTIENEHYYPRKLSLPEGSFILTGARGVGKSALIINYLKNYDHNSYLYIDCQDPVFILEELEANELEYFIEEESIKILVLDNYFNGFLERFPKVENLIIIAKEPILELDLPIYKLYPLDFEEFINFSKTQNINSAFNLYIKKGSLPNIAKSSNINNASKELFFEKFETQEGKVLLILAIFNTKVTTPHQIYQRAKEHFKISKDWLYKTIKEFEKEGIIYQIQPLEKGFGKKLLIYDFAFATYLNKHQRVNTKLDSIVALALIKHNIDIKASLNPLGYLTSNNELILISQFETEETMWSKIQKNFGFFTKLKIKDVTIVTISNSYNFKIKNITFNALPFNEWVVGQD